MFVLHVVVLIFTEDLGLDLARSQRVNGRFIQQIKHRVVVHLENDIEMLMRTLFFNIFRSVPQQK